MYIESKHDTKIFFMAIIEHPINKMVIMRKCRVWFCIVQFEEFITENRAKMTILRVLLLFEAIKIHKQQLPENKTANLPSRNWT